MYKWCVKQTICQFVKCLRFRMSSDSSCNQHLLQKNTRNDSSDYCPAIWDGFICWPETPSNTTIHLPCPTEKGLDASKFASRKCGSDGKWIGRSDSLIGWSNYTSCFTEQVKILMKRLYHGSNEEVEIKLNTAKSTRMIEMLGLSVSLMSLFMSLIIFHKISSLKNKRTKLHRNLFLAMFLQVAIRLILYVDQWITRDALDSAVIIGRAYNNGIERTIILCEIFYSVMEYAQTSVFTWMLLEGINLHTSIVVVFPKKIKFFVFHIVGWGFPLVLVLTWCSVMAAFYNQTLCWWGYNFSPYFWILEGPRLFIILVNLVILLNIVCVVVMKVQQSTSNEFQQIRKAIRAALLLLPLLGITNLLDIIPGPLDNSPLRFAIWSYSTHILSSCQGLFLSFLYCFLNHEVRDAVKKQWMLKRITYSSHLKCSRDKEIMNNEAMVCTAEIMMV